MQEFITRKLVQALARKATSQKEEDGNIQAQESEMRSRCRAYISDALEGASEYSIEMHGLRKEYGTSNLFPWRKTKKTTALEGNWFGVRKGEN